MYSQIAANKRKTWFIMLAFLMVASLLAWAISSYYGDPSMTVIILVVAGGYALFSYYNAGKMAVAMNGAKQIEQKDNPRFYRIVENLAITDGLPMPKVYIIDDPALNAFATGRDPDHAIVAATSGLLDLLDDSEVEGVMAHELGHVKNYDIRVSMIAFALVAVIAIISDIFLRMQFFGGRRNSNNEGGAIIAVIALVVAVLAPIAATLLQLAISRKREYLADATGALTTRYPEGLASALGKISKQGSVLKRQNTSTAHLFFASPLKAGFMSKLFSTHPPIQDRIARLHEMGGEL